MSNFKGKIFSANNPSNCVYNFTALPLNSSIIDRFGNQLINQSINQSINFVTAHMYNILNN